MRKFKCIGCGKESHPSFELDSHGKLVARCPKQGCGSINADFGPEHFQTAAVRVDQSDQPGAGRMEFRDLDPASEALKITAPSFGKQLVPGAFVPPPSAAASPVGPNTTQAAPAGPKPWAAPPDADIVTTLQARRQYLEGEVARLEPFRRELKSVSKMLKIALEDRAKEEVARARAAAPIGEA